MNNKRTKNDNRLEVNSQESELKDNLYYRGNSITSLTLDILNGCSYSCPGCHVHKENIDTIDDNLINFFKDLESKGCILDELAIGPTSFLSSSNTEDILKTKEFKKLMNMFETIEFNTPVPKDEELDTEKILYLCSLTNAKYIDLEMVLDITEFMENPEYVEKMRKWQDIILTDKRISTVYLSNFVTEHEYLNYSLEEITKKVTYELNSVFRYNLSFLRSKDKDLLKSNLIKFNEKNKGSVNNISEYNAMVNNHMTLTYEENKLYLQPVLNAPTNYTNESLTFTYNKLEDYLKKVEEMSVFNYKHLLFEECKKCDNVAQCIETFRMNILRDNEAKECLFYNFKKE